MNSTLALPRSALRWILLQRPTLQAWERLCSRFGMPRACKLRFECLLRTRQIRSSYQHMMTLEYASLREFLPVKAEHIIDIGCGLAAIDVYLYRHYQGNPALELFLLDKTKLTAMPRYGLKASDEFYNSQAVAERLLRLNGVPANQIRLVEATADYALPNFEFDLVLSLASWGFHYPVETYLEPVWRALRPGGKIVIDVRAGAGEEDALAKRFGRLRVLAEPWDGRAIRFGAEKGEGDQKS